MKVYSVKPGSEDIRCSDGRIILADGPIAWGDGRMPTAFRTRAILMDVLGDRVPAIKWHQFLKRDVIMGWSKDAPHAITEDEIRQFVTEKRKRLDESRPLIERMARERPEYVTDRPGPDQGYRGGIAPTLQPNKPKEDDNVD